MGNTIIDEAADFLLKYSTYEDREKLRERIQKHVQYKTAYIVRDKNDSIVSVCLWNISPDYAVVDVFDCAIREDHRGKDLMRRMLWNGLKTWPVKYIRYEKGYDDGLQDKPKTVWSVERMLRRKG